MEESNKLDLQSVWDYKAVEGGRSAADTHKLAQVIAAAYTELPAEEQPYVDIEEVASHMKQGREVQMMMEVKHIVGVVAPKEGVHTRGHKVLVLLDKHQTDFQAQQEDEVFVSVLRS